MDPLRILVADGDFHVRRALCTALESEGWEPLEAADEATVLRMTEEEGIDLVMLDLHLGRRDGLKMAQNLRIRKNVPILIVTGRGAPDERVRGLECGADDYVVKPFRPREVILRIRHILDRYRREDEEGLVRFDHTAFDLRRKLVRHLDGENVDLTGMELQLLELFIRNAGRVLTRDEISQSLHGRNWSPYDRTIDGHVARLRRKIEPPGEAPQLIRSVRGVGYVFAGDVTPLDDG